MEEKEKMVVSQKLFNQTSARTIQRKQATDRTFTKVKNMYSKPVEIHIAPHHNKVNGKSPK